MNTRSRLLIRADASVAIGTGHVMRTLALAQAWQRAGGEVHYALAEATPAIVERLDSEGANLRRLSVELGSDRDAARTAELAESVGAEWIVVDGYHFGPDYQAALRRSGMRQVFVDDNCHAGSYSAQIVLNPSIHAEEIDYSVREPDTRLQLGPRYALLRSEFLVLGRGRRAMPVEARRMLVTLGGSDPENVTDLVLSALESVPGEWETVVVVGGSNPHLSSLSEHAGKIGPQVKVVHNVPSMPELMAAADLAVIAGGSTYLEAAYLGVPAVVITLADNQALIAARIRRDRLAACAGWHAELTPASLAAQIDSLRKDREERSRISAASVRLVDGQGADRVVEAMQGRDVVMRTAVLDDMERLFRWANDPVVRASSFTSDPIVWDDHRRWFSAKLGDRNTRIYIAESLGEPAGVIRFDQQAGEAVAGISVDAAFRGRGLAATIVREGTARYLLDFPDAAIAAYIRPENKASIRAFQRARYRFAGECLHVGQTCLRYIYWPAGSTDRKPLG